MSHTIAKTTTACLMRSRLAAWSFLLAGIAGGAQASSFLEGHDFAWRETSDHPTGQWNNNVRGIVGPGIEFSSSYYELDISDTGLSLQFRGNFGFMERYPQVNGFNLESPEVLGDMGLSVAVVSSPWPGFGDRDQYRLLFEPGTLRIDFGGLTVHSGNTLVLSLTPVPEPATAGLLAAGLSVMFWFTQARRNRDSEQL